MFFYFMPVDSASIVQNLVNALTTAGTQSNPQVSVYHVVCKLVCVSASHAAGTSW